MQNSGVSSIATTRYILNGTILIAKLPVKGKVVAFNVSFCI